MKWGLTNECFEDEKREETYRKVCYFVKIKPEILAFALNSNINDEHVDLTVLADSALR